MLLFNVLNIGLLLLGFEHAELKVDEAWYATTASQFDFCVQTKFEHPICPPIFQKKGYQEREHLNFRVQAPQGPLTSENFYRALSLYQMKQAPAAWLATLNLADGPKGVNRKLWAEATYLYAKVLFDQRQMKESAKHFDKVVEDLKGRSVYHQERAWAYFFNGKLDRSLGSAVSAQSKLIHPVPYFDKYFLRGLIERETCHWANAFNTIDRGRIELRNVKISEAVNVHPFVTLCDRGKLGQTCNRLREYYSLYYHAKIEQALKDLDLLEIEMRDRGITRPRNQATSEIIWPYVGENWADELGYFSVPVRSVC